MADKTLYFTPLLMSRIHFSLLERANAGSPPHALFGNGLPASSPPSRSPDETRVDNINGRLVRLGLITAGAAGRRLRIPQLTFSVKRLFGSSQQAASRLLQRREAGLCCAPAGASRLVSPALKPPSRWAGGGLQSCAQLNEA